MANYKQAIRENWKFNTNVGVLTVGQLFTASDATLIQLEEDLKEEVKNAKKPNRFSKVSQKDKTPKLKLEVVSDIIDTIIEEREDAANASKVKQEEQELLALLKEKENEEKKNMSKEEILAKLKELKK